MSSRQRAGSLLSDQNPNILSPFRASNGTQTSPSVEEKSFSLFQPDILLPTQYFATTKRKDHLEPEKKLLLAVLEDAIWCFQHCLLARDKKRRGLFNEAEEWMIEENSDSLFSFESICEVLGLNPQYVREGLMRWKEKESVKRPKAQVYRMSHRNRGKKAKTPKPAVIGHKFLKAAGF